MFKELSPNIKSSITRSISQTYEQYMERIDWDEDAYDIEDYLMSWKEYINERALWYETLSAEQKEDPQFHEDMAVRINEVILKMLTDPPSEEQVAAIELLQEELGTHFDYACKAEATYVENKLMRMKNKN